MTIVLPFEEAKQYIIEKLEEYLEKSRGINIRNGRNFHCINPDHVDRNPSMGFYRAKNRAHCFGCGKSYDIFNVIGLDFNLTSFKEELAKACELFGVQIERTNYSVNKIKAVIPKVNTQRKTYVEKSVKSFLKYYDSLSPVSTSTNYMHKRGISDEVCDKFKILYDPKFITRDNTRDTDKLMKWQAVIIPKTEFSYLARNTDAACKGYNRIRNHGKSALYNSQILDDNTLTHVFIVEGEFDVLSIYEVGGKSIGLGGVSGVDKLIVRLKSSSSRPVILIALDNDEAGLKAAFNLSLKLRSLDIPFKMVNLYETYKDANEMLLKDRVGLKNNVYKELHAEVVGKKKFVFKLS